MRWSVSAVTESTPVVVPCQISDTSIVATHAAVYTAPSLHTPGKGAGPHFNRETISTRCRWSLAKCMTCSVRGAAMTYACCLLPGLGSGLPSVSFIHNDYWLTIFINCTCTVIVVLSVCVPFATTTPADTIANRSLCHRDRSWSRKLVHMPVCNVADRLEFPLKTSKVSNVTFPIPKCHANPSSICP